MLWDELPSEKKNLIEKFICGKWKKGEVEYYEKKLKLIYHDDDSGMKFHENSTFKLKKQHDFVMDIHVENCTVPTLKDLVRRETWNYFFYNFIFKDGWMASLSASCVARERTGYKYEFLFVVYIGHTVLFTMCVKDSSVNLSVEILQNKRHLQEMLLRIDGLKNNEEPVQWKTISTPPEHVLHFMMANHRRLGDKSLLNGMDGDLMSKIAGMNDRVIERDEVLKILGQNLNERGFRTNTLYYCARCLCNIID